MCDIKKTMLSCKQKYILCRDPTPVNPLSFGLFFFYRWVIGIKFTFCCQIDKKVFVVVLGAEALKVLVV